MDKGVIGEKWGKELSLILQTFNPRFYPLHLHIYGSQTYENKLLRAILFAMIFTKTTACKRRLMRLLTQIIKEILHAFEKAFMFWTMLPFAF